MRPTLDEGGRASLLHRLLEAPGAETGDGLGEAGKRVLVGRGRLVLRLLDLLSVLTSQERASPALEHDHELTKEVNYPTLSPPGIGPPPAIFFFSQPLLASTLLYSVS